MLSIIVLMVAVRSAALVAKKVFKKNSNRISTMRRSYDAWERSRKVRLY